MCTVLLLCAIYNQESLGYSSPTKPKQIVFTIRDKSFNNLDGHSASRNENTVFASRRESTKPTPSSTAHPVYDSITEASTDVPLSSTSRNAIVTTTLVDLVENSRDITPQSTITTRSTNGIGLHRLPLEALGVTQQQLDSQISLSQNPIYAISGVYTTSVLGRTPSPGEGDLWDMAHLPATVRCGNQGHCHAFGRNFSVYMDNDILRISNSSYVIKRADLPTIPYGNYAFSLGSAKLFWKRTDIGVRNVFKRKKTPRSKAEIDIFTKLGEKMCAQLSVYSHKVWMMPVPVKFREGNDVNDVRCTETDGNTYSMSEFLAPRSMPFSRTIIDFWPTVPIDHSTAIQWYVYHIGEGRY